MVTVWIQSSLPLQLIPYPITGPSYLKLPKLLLPHNTIIEEDEFKRSPRASSLCSAVASGSSKGLWALPETAVENSTADKKEQCEANWDGSGVRTTKEGVACGFCQRMCNSLG